MDLDAREVCTFHRHSQGQQTVHRILAGEVLRHSPVLNQDREYSGAYLHPAMEGKGTLETQMGLATYSDGVPHHRKVESRPEEAVQSNHLAARFPGEAGMAVGLNVSGLECILAMWGT